MDNTGITVGRGIGVLDLLGVAFVVMKLCGVIGWRWFWVLMPFWIQLAAGAFILLVIALFLVFCHRDGM